MVICRPSTRNIVLAVPITGGYTSSTPRTLEVRRVCVTAIFVTATSPQAALRQGDDDLHVVVTGAERLVVPLQRHPAGDQPLQPRPVGGGQGVGACLVVA